MDPFQWQIKSKASPNAKRVHNLAINQTYLKIKKTKEINYANSQHCYASS